MAKEYHREESATQSVSEPGAVYAATPRTEMSANASPFLRVASDEELAQCITLDQLHEELTEMIHRHYHPEA
jgi:hypothetical protein